MSLSGERSRNGTFQPVGFGAEDKFGLKAERGLGERGGTGDSGPGPLSSLRVYLLGVAVGSRGGLQAGSASVILGQWPPWAQPHLGNRFQGRWKAEGSLLVYRGAFFSFFFSRVSLAMAQSRGSSRHQEGGMWI